MRVSDLDAAILITRALGNPARMRTVLMLRTGELCVCQITAVLELAASTVSVHLKELKRAGLVNERKEGRWVFFSLTDHPEVRPWIETALAAAATDPQTAADDRRVAELRRIPVEDLCRLGYEKAKALHNDTARAPCEPAID